MQIQPCFCAVVCPEVDACTWNISHLANHYAFHEASRALLLDYFRDELPVLCEMLSIALRSSPQHIEWVVDNVRQPKIGQGPPTYPPATHPAKNASFSSDIVPRYLAFTISFAVNSVIP